MVVKIYSQLTVKKYLELEIYRQHDQIKTIYLSPSPFSVISLIQWIKILLMIKQKIHEEG